MDTRNKIHLRGVALGENHLFRGSDLFDFESGWELLKKKFCDPAVITENFI